MKRLKRSIQIGDLKPAEGDQEKYGTEFQASRGGWFKPTEKPVPGAKKPDNK